MIRRFYAYFNELLSFPHVYLNEWIVRRLIHSKGGPGPSERVRIAFVKQEVAPGFYCTEATASARELLETAFKHTGPIGLATSLGAHFPIVKTTDDPETQIWKDAIRESGHGKIEDYEVLKTLPWMGGARGHAKSTGEFAVDVDRVDWSKYDIVISAFISIPTRVIRKFPKTTWVYFCDPPVTTHYRQSSVRPLFGYDLFLNLRYRTMRLLPRRNASHVIDWPYNFNYYGAFHKALGKPVQEDERREGVFVEAHSAKLLTPEQRRALEKFGPVRTVSPRTIYIVEDLMRSKYYVRLGGRLLWGNPQIEGIAAGCLFIADPRGIMNKSLSTRRASIRSFSELIDRLNEFESDPAAYRRELEKQRALLDHFCYRRPLEDLLEKHRAVQKGR